MSKSLQDIRDLFNRLRAEIHNRIIGQDDAIDLVLVAMFAGRGSHVLLEGVPGVGKTELLKTIATATDVKFSRIQMTVDLLPGDITGMEIYNPKTQEFESIKGPIFANFVLADELNRATPKTAGALLEAMQESQVTTVFSGTTKLEEPFMLFATQNPIEQEGTYELAEAQADRFLMKVKMGYPTFEEEYEIADLNAASEKRPIDKVMTGQDIIDIRHTIEQDDMVYIDPILRRKVVRLVRLTRPQPEGSSIAQEVSLEVGASPRSPTAFIRAARVLAIMEGRDFVTPADILHLARPILRHRMKFDRRVRKEQREGRLDTLLESIFHSVFSEG